MVINVLVEAFFIADKFIWMALSIMTKERGRNKKIGTMAVLIFYWAKIPNKKFFAIYSKKEFSKFHNVMY